jgi:hypothetical protein
MDKDYKTNKKSTSKLQQRSESQPSVIVISDSDDED